MALLLVFDTRTNDSISSYNIMQYLIDNNFHPIIAAEIIESGIYRIVCNASVGQILELDLALMTLTTGSKLVEWKQIQDGQEKEC